MNENLAQDLQSAINSVQKPYNKIIFFCIGTDRCTGDSYGPLVGHMLEQKLNSPDIKVCGTLHNPVHANNLEEKLNAVDAKNNLVIAIDAALGYEEEIKEIKIKKCVRPGKGVGKNLPYVGDIGIIAIVNSNSEFLDSINLTRLSTVYDLALETTNAILEIVNKDNIKEAVCM